MQVVSIRGEAGVDIEAIFAARDDKENARGRNRARDLRDHVGNQIGSREALAYDQAKADGGIQMSAGNVSDGERHREDSEAEGQGHARESDAKRRKASSQDGRL